MLRRRPARGVGAVRGTSSSGGSPRGASRARRRRAAAPRWPASGRRARSARTAPARPRRRWRRGRRGRSRRRRSASRQRSSDLLGRAAVEAAVDLGAAAGAAPLGVGDRREAERRGDAAGAVLAVHLLERERHDLALADERALLEHEHVEAGLGEQRRRRRAAGAGADDEHLGVAAVGRRSRGHRTAGRRSRDVSGQVSQT